MLKLCCGDVFGLWSKRLWELWFGHLPAFVGLECMRRLRSRFLPNHARRYELYRVPGWELLLCAWHLCHFGCMCSGELFDLFCNIMHQLHGEYLSIFGWFDCV